MMTNILCKKDVELIYLCFTSKEKETGMIYLFRYIKKNLNIFVVIS